MTDQISESSKADAILKYKISLKLIKLLKHGSKSIFQVLNKLACELVFRAGQQGYDRISAYKRIELLSLSTFAKKIFQSLKSPDPTLDGN